MRRNVAFHSATICSSASRPSAISLLNASRSTLTVIAGVFFVSKLADATSAQVHQSAEEYAAARKDLSGYRLGLDLVTAQHFGFPKAPGLLYIPSGQPQVE